VSAPAISIDRLTRDFGTLRAVDQLSFEVPAGAIIGFLGPNGSGKTTTIKLLLGLLEPTAGSATILGFDVRTQGAEIRERTGAVLEHTGVYEQLSAEDNLEFYGRVWRLPADERRSRIRTLLTAMDLWDRRREKAEGWSRGMLQRLALARAILHRPALLFLDEPTAGLDVMAATAVREDLERLARTEGVTIFLTTHNMTEAERLCSTVVVIRKGRVVASGSPAALSAQRTAPRLEITGRGFGAEVLERVRRLPEVAGIASADGHCSIDLRGSVDAAGVVRALVEAGAEVDEVVRAKASLEEVFLTLMQEER